MQKLTLRRYIQELENSFVLGKSCKCSWEGRTERSKVDQEILKLDRDEIIPTMHCNILVMVKW